jgi:heme oxygenase
MFSGKHEPNGPPLTLLQRLRAETRPWHEALERDLELLGPRADRNSYGRFLAGMYGYRLSWESEAARWLAAPWPEFFAQRRKTPQLAEDLHSLGVSVAAVKPIPMPHWQGMADLWGSLYVLEGSMLGGQVIARAARDRWQLSDEHGLCYFLSYGSQLRAMWQEFCEELTARTRPEDADATVEAARRTFEQLHAWLIPSNNSRSVEVQS